MEYEETKLKHEEIGKMIVEDEEVSFGEVPDDEAVVMGNRIFNERIKNGKDEYREITTNFFNNVNKNVKKRKFKTILNYFLLFLSFAYFIYFVYFTASYGIEFLLITQLGILCGSWLLSRIFEMSKISTKKKNEEIINSWKSWAGVSNNDKAEKIEANLNSNEDTLDNLRG